MTSFNCFSFGLIQIAPINNHRLEREKKTLFLQRNNRIYVSMTHHFKASSYFQHKYIYPEKP